MTGTLNPPRPSPLRRRPPAPPAPPAAGRRAGPRPHPVERRRPTARQRRADSHRVLAMLVVAVVAFGLLGARLVFLQASPPEEYRAFGERQLVHEIALPAARGAIFDRNGRELALSVRQSTVWANPRQVTDPAGQAAALAPMLGVDAALLQARLSKDAAFVYLARTVPDSVASQVEALGLPGVHLIEEPKRFTPASDLAAPVLGRVGTDNEGLSGIELQFEQTLAGKPGRKTVEQTPAGQPYDGLRELTSPVRGDDLVLTLDRSLQFETERALANEITIAAARGGVAIVMDTASGEILALANLSANPDGAGPPVPSDKNTAVTNVYEPGSVNKLITIAGALEEDLVRADTKISVAGTIKVADHVFKEHDPHPTQDWSVTDIMANSSNVGSILIGQQLGKERLDEYLRAFGFGAKTGMGFPGESRGIMLDPSEWSGTSLPTIAIGQGIAVSAMQMLAAYNTVANGGEYVAPKLVKATVDARGESHPTPPSARRRVISPRTAKQVTGMLAEVVRVGTGTNAAIDGYTVAGKTGTARKPLENARGYKGGAYISSFAGFVPAEKPALTSIVMLDEPTPIFGGLVAAPVFAEINRYGLRQFRIPPPLVDLPAVVPEVSVDVIKEGSSEPVGVAPPVAPPTTVAGNVPTAAAPAPTP
ncbi:MAG TPA: penicillin-binding protein 2 [Acidimicrobiales bacterium]|nr:penicillin-binding protein 2 [Acidimicrobiales bacterium]